MRVFKLVTRAEMGKKLKSCVELTHIPSSSAFISFLFPRHTSMLGYENWASNRQCRQEMTHRLTTVSHI